jgi:hypothetical protein
MQDSIRAATLAGLGAASALCQVRPFGSDAENVIPVRHTGGPGSKFDVGIRIVRDVV